MNVKQKDKPSSAGNSGPWTPVLCFSSLSLQSRRQFCVSFLTPAFYWHIAASIKYPWTEFGWEVELYKKQEGSLLDFKVRSKFITGISTFLSPSLWRSQARPNTLLTISSNYCYAYQLSSMSHSIAMTQPSSFLTLRMICCYMDDTFSIMSCLKYSS